MTITKTAFLIGGLTGALRSGGLSEYSKGNAQKIIREKQLAQQDTN